MSQRLAEKTFSALSAKSFASSAVKTTSLMLILLGCAAVLSSSQTRRQPRRTPAQTQAPRGSALKYSAFLHGSEKHKSLECNACHKIPTAWTAKRDFPDVADFPDHDSCVRCHRQQFFTRQAFSGGGPVICTACHLRAAPREEARFAFGKPNNSNQPLKRKDERQFTIEFPHDRHQNVIASLPRGFRKGPRTVEASFIAGADDKKPEYNNCAICHVTNNSLVDIPSSRGSDSREPAAGIFKTTPRTHDACFNCHWKNEKPAGADCAGCHKPAVAFIAADVPKRISAKFRHEGGKGEHVVECTTCHINITRAATLRGLTPDVPIAACTTCHKDNKKTTYPKAVTIEEEFEQNKRTGTCTYCHAVDVGSKKAPASHNAAAQ